MTWRDAPVAGCVIRSLHKFTDRRGWLAEVFRADELPRSVHPVMGYLSLTHPGITRGPHEHAHQTDLFVFFDGGFRLYLWDTRENSPTYGHRYAVNLGRAEPAAVLVPPGVVHAYRNIGSSDAFILNCPNRLYAGEHRAEPVDEIRYEDRADQLFVMN